MLLSWLIQCLLILLSVAFFTLFERNVIGLFHNRVGPNNVSFLGLLQPLLDAFNLLTNQQLNPLHSNAFIYSLTPQLALLVSLLTWLAMPSCYFFFSFNYSFLLFFLVSSITIFTTLLSGWSSNSNYSLIGSLRSVAQSISYESVFTTLLVIFVFFAFTFSIRSFVNSSSLIFLLFILVWFVTSLAELHRAPFDFSESESELVSGFNTEYSGANFAFLFLSEYAILLFTCVIISFLFFGWLLPFSSVMYTSSALIISFVFIWVRITFCRFRYDLLIITSWKILLPLTLFLFLSLIVLIV